MTQIKVCGMKYPNNIADLCNLSIHWMGMIFYPVSPRYVQQLDLKSLKNIPQRIKKTGVFLNESIENMIAKATEFHLQALQLHGAESPALCRLMKDEGYIVIKAFGIEKKEDLEASTDYDGCCDFFLFDTKTPSFGGSGIQFDWNILQYYQGNTPFFLSGGIGANDAPQLKSVKHPQLYGIDLNSRFETEPGKKDINLLSNFIDKLN